MTTRRRRHAVVLGVRGSFRRGTGSRCPLSQPRLRHRRATGSALRADAPDRARAGREPARLARGVGCSIEEEPGSGLTGPRLCKPGASKERRLLCRRHGRHHRAPSACRRFCGTTGACRPDPRAPGASRVFGPGDDGVPAHRRGAPRRRPGSAGHQAVGPHRWAACDVHVRDHNCSTCRWAGWDRAAERLNGRRRTLRHST